LEARGRTVEDASARCECRRNGCARARQEWKRSTPALQAHMHRLRRVKGKGQSAYQKLRKLHAMDCDAAPTWCVHARFCSKLQTRRVRRRMKNGGASKCDVRLFQAASFALETRGFAFESRTCSSPAQTLHARTKKMDASKSRPGNVEAQGSTLRCFPSALRSFTCALRNAACMCARFWCTSATPALHGPNPDIGVRRPMIHASKSFMRGRAANRRQRPERNAVRSAASRTQAGSPRRTRRSRRRA